MMERKIPRCMSTQHPDNARIPFFSDGSIIDGETEIKEAYYVFSHLGCEEQMWDYEGKEVDNFVVKKLLSRYEDFFRRNMLGKDVFITPRLPNPSVEKAEAKILLETLESIPRSFDAARLFYKNTYPIFEVILPMTTSHLELNRVYEYYKRFVAGKANFKFSDGTTIREWIGEFYPEEIRIIPLIEDKKGLLGIKEIIAKFIADKELGYQRVFLARSDPALNYGLVPAVLMNKFALASLYEVEEEHSIEIFPIIGKGSCPFRGNLNPYRARDVMKEYPYVHTFTIQSAFKYDYPEERVREAIESIKGNNKRKYEEELDNAFIELIERYSLRYRACIESIADLINKISRYVPQRRKRKLHIGLFGYSRGIGKKTLPRAIKFCCALYSLGIPPEIIGMDGISIKDLEQVSCVYRKLFVDLSDALRFVNKRNVVRFLPNGKKLLRVVEQAGIEYEVDKEHEMLTSQIVKILGKNNKEVLGEYITKAATIRRFLG
ncbi:MAG TPA: phosphoenolpyruvate carboxylase [Candidatus Aenigmarchaeota archaeon]|nr:MAG: phosphoenolpyruvate carboxylase [Candidatus Aenigmarchaeota archaeon]HDD46297.1 phosphoenolpyruvate carboxylase [Candidatus Aenigmarchaeota archaeon]